MVLGIVDKKKAEHLLKEHVEYTCERRMEAVADVVNVSIVDKLVAPTAMGFDVVDDEVQMMVGVQDDTYHLHTHALSQMAVMADTRKTYSKTKRSGFYKYARSLFKGEQWERELLASNLNTLFHKGKFLDRRKDSARFLHRYVGDTLRGFLSRSYNRKLTTVRLLPSFLETCDVLGAEPTQAFASDVRVNIKCMLPQVYEPVDNEFVAFGVTFTNSDFGAGQLKIVGSVLRLNSGTFSVVDEGYSRTHLGSIIKESDIVMSDVTADKEVEAVKSAIKDSAEGQLALPAIEKMLDAIQYAHEKEMPWYRVKNLLKTVLNKRELEKAEDYIEKDVEELPPVNRDADGDPIATKWWVSNLIGKFANEEDDVERKSKLQAAAGGLLVKKAA